MPVVSPARRLLTAALAACSLLLAACASSTGGPPPDEPDTDGGPLTVGGLTAGQAGRLQALNVPVVVPGDPGDFALAVVEAERRDGGLGPGAVRYALEYRRADGACFEVSGGTDGFGGPDLPLVVTEVTVDGLGGRTVQVYQAADDPGATSAQVWGIETVVSEFIDLDGAAALFLSDTQGGCRPVSLDEGARIVSGLRLLSDGPPRPEPIGRIPRASELGAFAPADDVLNGLNTASSPEVAAQAIARRYEGDAGRATVDVLSETSYEAVALVTLLDLRDDSVRDERLRLTYTRVGEAWELVQAGRQVRCQPGRGSADWTDGACR